MKLSLITGTYQRLQSLAQRALPSVLAQGISPADFEWIVVNDGADPATAALIEALDAPFPIIHLPIRHPTNGFGLCHARNVGLQAAGGDVVAYLDDDNSLAPCFVAQTIQFFSAHPEIKCCIPQQRRQRISPQKKGTPFISPTADCTTAELIRHDQLFDSNGFAHRRVGAPRWNPEFRIFCDYEYFLQALGCWGLDAFAIQPEVLVNYVQTTDGVIGQSRYGDWARELESLCHCSSNHREQQYPVIRPHLAHLQAIATQWRNKADRAIAAFRPTP